jgi:TatD DNase family protein
MNIIDSHCHLEVFYNKGEKYFLNVINKSLMFGVKHFITVGTKLNNWKIYNFLARKYPKIISYTVGLHPLEISSIKNCERELELIPTFFKNKFPPVAMGEIGLDFFKIVNPKESLHKIEKIKYKQKIIFKQQLEIAKDLQEVFGSFPIVIHSRNAFWECLKIIEEVKIDWNRIIFHCWSEDKKKIKIVNENGGRASFSGTITYDNNKNIKSSCKEQGLEKLIIETDSPYLLPKFCKNNTDVKFNEPSYIIHNLIECFFSLQNTSCSKDKFNSIKIFSEKVFKNTKNFFKLKFL